MYADFLARLETSIYHTVIREKAKRNAELIQLLELHQQFESLIQYSQVSRVGILRIYDI